MNCLYPQIKETLANGSRFEFEHRCGQCLTCRILKRSQMATRLHLESLSYPNAATMVTFTYNDKHKPQDGSVQKIELRKLKWRINDQWKRYRKKFPQIAQADNYHEKLRFYGVGEYGDDSMRPHYHLAIFGLPVDLQYEDPKKQGQKLYYEICRKRHFQPVLFPGLEQFLLKAWQHRGHVQIEQLDDGLSSYMTGYVTKKMTNYKDHEALGLVPEFSSGSPGMGRDYAAIIGDSMARQKLYPHGYGEFEKGPDWKPVEWSSLVRVNGKKRPLDAYMRQRILKVLGCKEYDPDTKRRRNMMRTLRKRHGNTVKFGAENGAIIDLQEQNKNKYRANKWLRKARAVAKSKKI